MKTLTKFFASIIAAGFLMAAGNVSAVTLKSISPSFQMFHIVGSGTSFNTYAASLATHQGFTVEGAGDNSYRVGSTDAATGSVMFSIKLNAPGACNTQFTIPLALDDSNNITVVGSGVYPVTLPSGCANPPTEVVVSGNPKTAVGYTLTLK